MVQRQNKYRKIWYKHRTETEKYGIKTKYKRNMV